MSTQDEIQKELLSKVPKNLSGLLYVAPRVGKTRMAFQLIDRDEYTNVLWVTPSKLLVDKGLKEEAAACDFDFSKLTTSTYASLHKVKGSFDLILLDEVHHVTYRNTINLFSGELTYKTIVGMSGTKTRDADKKEIFYSLKLYPFVDYDIKQAREDKIISDYTVEVINVELDTQKNLKVEFQKSFFYTSEKLSYMAYTKKMKESSNTQQKIRYALLRKSVIANAANKFVCIPELIEGRTLIFVSTQKQAESLNYFYHSTSGDKWLKAFEEKQIPFLTLVSKGGTGYTFYGIDTVIITQADSDNNGQVVQKIMRGMLKDVKHLKVKILCAKGTQDEVWVNKVLENF